MFSRRASFTNLCCLPRQDRTVSAGDVRRRDRLGAFLVCTRAVHETFVASYGDDPNDGSHSSPKRNFRAAHDAASDGGQIVVLDTAGHGRLSIAKSLEITTPTDITAFVTVGLASNSPAVVLMRLQLHSFVARLSSSSAQDELG